MNQIEQIISFGIAGAGREDHDDNIQYNFNNNLMETILKPTSNDNIFIISICGPRQSGKSFLMNYILRHLKAKAEDPDTADEDPLGWGQPDIPTAPLAGFPWGHNKEINKTGGGIWLTTEPIILKSSEKSLSVYLMDTEATSEKQNDVVVKFCLRFSNFLICNSPYEVPEAFLASLGQMLDEISPAASELLFLVRDWESIGEFGESGGRLLKQQLFSGPVSSNCAKKLQSKVGKYDCFLLPHPGAKSQEVEFNGSLASIHPKFSTNVLEELLLFIFQGERLFQAKFTLGSEMIAKFARYEICTRFQNAPIKAKANTEPGTPCQTDQTKNRSPEELNQEICNRLANTFEAKLRAKVKQQTLPTPILTQLQTGCEQGAFGAFKRERLYGSFKIRQRAENFLRDQIYNICRHSHEGNDKKLRTARGFLMREMDNCLSSYNRQIYTLLKDVRDEKPEIITPNVEALQDQITLQFRKRIGGRNYHYSLLDEFSQDLARTMKARFRAQSGEIRHKEQAKTEIEWQICQAKIETEYKNEMKAMMKSALLYSSAKLQEWHRLLSEKFKHNAELPSTKNEEYKKKLDEFLGGLFNRILECNEKEKNAFLSKMSDKMEPSLSAYVSRVKDVLNTQGGLTPALLKKHSQDAKENAVSQFKGEILVSVDADDVELLQDMMTKFDEYMLIRSEEIERVFQAQTQLKKTNIINQYVNKFKAKINAFREANPFASSAAIDQVRKKFDLESINSFRLVVCSTGGPTWHDIAADIEAAMNDEVDRIQKEVDAMFGKQRKAAEKIVQDIVLDYTRNGAQVTIFLGNCDSLQELQDWQSMKMKACIDSFKSTCPIKDGDFVSEFVPDLQQKLQVRFNQERTELTTKLEKEETIISQKIGLEIHKYRQEMKSFLKTKDFHLPKEFLRKHGELVDTIINNMNLPNMTSTGRGKIKALVRPSYEKYRERNDMNTPVESPAIGIDLGTTYCCVAIYQKGRVQVIPTIDHKDVVPSYVGLHPQEEIVGELAKIRAHEHPADTIFDAKRLIGRKYSDLTVQADMKLWPFTVSRKSHSTVDDIPVIHSRGVKYEPEQISAKLLAHLKRMAEKYLGKPVEKAVITVPAYFNDGQRQATIDAGEIAGLEVLHILNEPTAAAIAYYLHHASRHDLAESDRPEKHILVYDLGGGTFDVSVLTMRIGSGEVRVRAVNGDTHLGGEDFDNNMVEFCVKKFKEQKGLDVTREDWRHPEPSTSHGSTGYITPAQKQRLKMLGTLTSSTASLTSQIPRRLRRIRNACEDVKKALSFAESGAVILDAIYGEVDMNIPITRKDFEQMNQEYFDKTIEIVKKALADAKLGKYDIDEVVLVGGSTRIPKVQEMVENFFGKMSMNNINPDMAVAHGAAVLAAKLNGIHEQRVRNIFLNDVCPLSIGVEVKDGSLSVIVPRNTQLPTIKRNNSYQTAHDSQTSVCFRIFEGEEKMARTNHLLGEFTLNNIPPRKRGEEKLTVNMEVNEAGILHVTAICDSTGESNQITINEQKGRLTKGEIRLHRAQMV